MIKLLSMVVITKNLSVVEDPDELELGPAMLKLTKPQRRFVIAKSQGLNDRNAAIAAGYAAPEGKPNQIDVQAHTLAHNPKVLEAMLEVARAAMLGRGVQVAMNTLIEISSDPTAQKKDRNAASDSILDRAGITRVTKHEMAVTHKDITGDEAIKKLENFSKQFGLDAAKVIESVTIDADFEEVKDEGEKPGDETSIEGIL